MTMPASSLEIVLRDIENIDVGPEKVNSLGMSILNFGDRDFLVLCKDPSSGEIFDALTDETIEMQEGIPFPGIKSKLGGYQVYGGVPSMSSQAESQE